ncbi:MAG: polyprenyl synthetase family protein [candidate division WOR-3 bacterium]
MFFKSYEYIIEPLNKVNKEIEKAFTKKYFSKFPPIYKEGKRLRAVINLFTSKAFEKYDRNIIKIATSLELIHFSSLIHDDVIDNADTRRNSISVNRLFGNHTAILIGDYLFSKALNFISSIKNPLIFKEFSRAAYLMCEGEIIEEFTERENTFCEDYYFDLIYKKTGALFESASILGAFYREEKNKKFGEFGKKFGILYQIFDDIIDFLYEEDIKQGKVTLPLIYTKSQIFKKFPEFKKKKDGIEIKKLKEIVIENKGIQKSMKKGEKFIKEIKTILKSFSYPLNKFLNSFVDEIHAYVLEKVNKFKEV